MRTWGVSTKPDQRDAASAASHPSTVIYVTVSEDFMTACKSSTQSTQVPLPPCIQQQGAELVTFGDGGT